MLSPKIEKAFNDHLNAELFSSYLYLSMAAHFESCNFRGMAQWMHIQAQEELAHALKFQDHILERGGRVTLLPITGPTTEWKSPLAAFQDAVEHERMVTGLINDLVDLAIGERDHASAAFLQWFVTEQVEEEATAQEVAGKLELAGDQADALLMLDAELGKRVSTPPPTGQPA